MGRLERSRDREERKGAAAMKMAALDFWVREQEGIHLLTGEKIEELQLKKLNMLLAKEKERGGFYQDLPAWLSDLSELSKLPFTTEEDLKEQGHRMVLLSQAKINRIRTEETSGTTGQAKRVYYSAADNERTISFFAAGLSELVHAGEKTMICMPFTGPGGLGELISEAIRRLGAEPLETGIGKTYRELLGVLKAERPQTFVGMPVPLLSLLRLEGERSSLRRALVSADACPKTVMAEIEARLCSRLYPHYGSRELGLGGAVTCPAFSGMHLRENDIIAEIVDEAGRPLPRGQWGELVITTVQAEAMPLIRYRTGDYTRLMPGICPCGSPLARLDRVVRLGGRSRMERLDSAVFAIPEILDYRAVLEEKVLYLEGYVTGPCESLPAELLGYPVRWKLQPFSEEFLPCYAAKRSIRQVCSCDCRERGIQ